MTTSRGLGIAFLIALVLGEWGCQRLRKGVEAFYAQRFADAIEYLEPVAEDLRRKPRQFEVSLGSMDDWRVAAGTATRDYFIVWHALAGSQFGLSRTDEGCRLINESLRPMTLLAHLPSREVRSMTVDPRDGDDWSAETMTLRTWAGAFRCR